MSTLYGSIRLQLSQIKQEVWRLLQLLCFYAINVIALLVTDLWCVCD